jgi:3'-phosphoadenosine 5'-phosphosulfate sulfotransferase (PAPS reductase)/FAD synthetase
VPGVIEALIDTYRQLRQPAPTASTNLHRHAAPRRARAFKAAANAARFVEKESRVTRTAPEILPPATSAPRGRTSTCWCRQRRRRDAAGAGRRGPHRAELPKFSDGRAFSQAYLLRRRRKFAGDIRATGDVLVDQLFRCSVPASPAPCCKEGKDAAEANTSSPAYAAFYQAGRRGAAAPCSHGAEMSAIDLHARPSKDYEAKLAETQKLLVRAAFRIRPLKQASSLAPRTCDHAPDQRAGAGHPGVRAGDRACCTRRRWTCWRAPRPPRARRWRSTGPVQESVVQFVAAKARTPCTAASSCARPAATSARWSRWSAPGRQKAWITGLRREQSPRAPRCRWSTPAEGKNGRAKINPLADWTWGDVWHYISQQPVDYNPLHDQFFPASAARPAPAAISLGEDFRAGRWWWEDEVCQGMRLAREERKRRSPHERPHRPQLLGRISNRHLDALEEEAIFVLREVGRRLRAAHAAVLRRQGLAGAAQVRREGLRQGPHPLPAADDRHRPQLPEVTDFRDFRAKELGAELIVRSVEDSMKRGTVRLAPSRRVAQRAPVGDAARRRSRNSASTP